MKGLTGTIAVFRREFAGYFATPLAAVFIVVFLFAAAIFTFYPGGFFVRGQADLKAFFAFHPWLFVVFIPAVAMRLWAEERRSGTLELLLTLPVDLGGVVLGKFLAAWALTGVALALTTPLWLTVSFLGRPDHGVILAGYVGSFLMAGGYLAIGSCLSATTRNQVIAFVGAVAVSFLFTVSGVPMVLDAFSAWAPKGFVSLIASFSFITRSSAIQDGMVDLRDALYFLTLIAVWLHATAVVIHNRKSG